MGPVLTAVNAGKGETENTQFLFEFKQLYKYFVR